MSRTDVRTRGAEASVGPVSSSGVIAAVRTEPKAMVDSIAADARVPVYRPHLGDEMQDADGGALEVGWLGVGKLTREFEQPLEAYLRMRVVRLCETERRDVTLPPHYRIDEGASRRVAAGVRSFSGAS